MSQVIEIDRSPVLSVQEAHDALEYALMHTGAMHAQFSTKNVGRLNLCLELIKRALGDKQ